MNSPFREIIDALVILFGAVWLFTSPAIKPVKKRESLWLSILYNIPFMLGFVLPLIGQFHAQALGWRFVPQSLVVEITGVCIAALGIGFAIWARLILGSNWSNIAAIKEGQQLIQRGPYAIVRNPIYTGILFYMLGAALTTGELRGLVGLGLVLISVLHKAKTEEKFLSEEFGDEYSDYRKKVKSLIPFIV